MKKHIYMLALIFFLTQGNVSAINVDSLKGIWSDSAQADTIRLKALKTLIWKVYLHSIPDSGIYFSDEQYKLAKNLNNKTWMGNSLLAKGSCYKSKGNFKEAIKYYLQSLQVYNEIKNNNGIGSAYNNIGIIYYKQGNDQKALKYYKKSLVIFQELGNKPYLINSYNNIGIIYKKQGENRRALKYYQKALNIVVETGNKNSMAMCYNNIGNIYTRLKNYKQALLYHDKSLQIRIKENHIRGIGSSYLNLGAVYKEQGDYDKAMDYYQKSLQIDLETKNKSGMSYCYVNIGTLYYLNDNFSKSTINSYKALKIAREVGMVNEIKSASKLLFEIYEKTGSADSALSMHELYIQMQDSIRKMENKEAEIKLEYQLEFEKEQALEEARHQESERRKELISYSAGGGMGLVLLFSVFIVNRLLLTRKQKNIIELQKTEVEDKRKEVLDSIRYAKRIQDALLTSDDYKNKVLPESFVFFKPKDIVSGDYYWIYENKSNQVYFTVADCTGHGVPGAFMSMIGTSLLNEIIIENGVVETDQILYDMRTHIINSLGQQGDIGENRDGMDMAICRWDKKDNKLSFSGAYNPLYIIRNGELLEHKANRRPVGYHIGKSIPFTKEEIQLKKNDILYIFSDGFIDQFGGDKGKKYRTSNFKNLLKKICDLPCKHQKEELEKELIKWKGEIEQVDDVCIMGVRF